MKKVIILILAVCLYASCGKRPLCYWEHPHNGAVRIHHDWSGIMSGERVPQSLRYTFFPYAGEIVDPSFGNIYRVTTNRHEYIELSNSLFAFACTTGKDSIEVVYLPPGMYNMYGRNVTAGINKYRDEADTAKYSAYLNYEDSLSVLYNTIEDVIPNAEMLHGSKIYKSYYHGVEYENIFVPNADTVDVYVKHKPVTYKLTITMTIDGTDEIVGVRALVGGVSKYSKLYTETPGNDELTYTPMNFTMKGNVAGGIITVFGLNPKDKINTILISLLTLEGTVITVPTVDITDKIDEKYDDLINNHKASIALKVTGRDGINFTVETDPWYDGGEEWIEDLN